MLILEFISCFFDKKYHFIYFQVFFMYFGFFQNFDKVFGIAQKSTSSCSFIANFFFQNSSITIQQHIKNLGNCEFLFFFKYLKPLKVFDFFNDFYFLFTSPRPFPFNLETFLLQISNILVQKEFPIAFQPF
jgi:hypothetical protein